MATDTKAKAQAKSANFEDPMNWDDIPDGEEIQTGFPPYWHVEEGAKFMGIVCAKDDSDPDFVRYVVQATRPIYGYRGKKRSEKVAVLPGEYFTVGVYSNLVLDSQIGNEIFVEVTGQIKADTPAGFVWGFKAKVIRRGVELPQFAAAAATKQLSDTNGGA